MSNTKTRIISGFVLLLIVVFSVISGPKACLTFMGVVGLLVIDELIINFYDQRRNSKKYILAQSYFGSTSLNITISPSLSIKPHTATWLSGKEK